MKRLATRALGFGMVIAAMTACTSEGDQSSITIGDSTLPPVTTAPVEFPGNEWSRAERGDWSALDSELAGANSSCVAVIKDGKLVHDAYFNGGSQDAPVRTYSITKSMTALLMGMAHQDGAVGVEDPVADSAASWRGTSAESIEVRDVLSMTSGRDWSEATDRTMIRQTSNQTQYAIDLNQAREPGEWQYDNAAVQVLERVLSDKAAPDGVVPYAEDRLLEPLGMNDTRWPTDGAGQATTYSGVESTCHDLARVGYLVLNQGRWGDQQLLAPEFVQQMTSPSSDRNAAYGWLWWTNAEGRVVEVLRQAGFEQDKEPYQGRIAPNVPADATWAFGYGNQYVAVVPSENLVAVRLGRRPASPDQVTFDSFTSGVLDALG